MSRDTNQFYEAQGARPTTYSESTMRPQQRRDAENWPYPSGFRLFSRSALLLLGAVPQALISSSRLAYQEKSRKRESMIFVR